MSKEHETWEVETFPLSDFKERLKEQRKAKGMNQEELAEAIGVTQSSISSYEKGDKNKLPTIDKLWAMAKTLGCSTDYLLGGEEAEDHDSSFVCEWTGLSGKAVEILHEAVENDNIASYRLLIDLFEYMLKQNRSYQTQTASGIPYYYRKSNQTSYMMNLIEYAVEARYSLRAWEAKQAKHDQGDQTSEEHEKLVDDIARAEDFLRANGMTPFSTEYAEGYWLREAAEKYKDIVEALINEKISEMQDYKDQFQNPLVFTPEREESCKKGKGS